MGAGVGAGWWLQIGVLRQLAGCPLRWWEGQWLSHVFLLTQKAGQDHGGWAEFQEREWRCNRPPET